MYSYYMSWLRDNYLPNSVTSLLASNCPEEKFILRLFDDFATKWNFHHVSHGLIINERPKVQLLLWLWLNFNKFFKPRLQPLIVENI